MDSERRPRLTPPSPTCAEPCASRSTRRWRAGRRPGGARRAVGRSGFARAGRGDGIRGAARRASRRRGDRRPRPAGRLGRGRRRGRPAGARRSASTRCWCAGCTSTAAGERAGGRGPRRPVRGARRGAAPRPAPVAVLLGHTLDDQAETVLLGLARGSGATSLQGMAAVAGPYLRPLLGIRRATTRQFCADAGLEPWDDPHNARPPLRAGAGARAGAAGAGGRARPGHRRGARPHRRAAARGRRRPRRDGRRDHRGDLRTGRGRHRRVGRRRWPRIRRPCASASSGTWSQSEFGVSPRTQRTRSPSLSLVTDWHGQKPLDLPGVRVERSGRNAGLFSTAAPHRAKDSSAPMEPRDIDGDLTEILIDRGADPRSPGRDVAAASKPTTPARTCCSSAC